MSTPRVLGYDDLHNYIEGCIESEQCIADDLDDEGKDNAREHWAKAEAYREMLSHIEHQLEWDRA